MANEKVAQALQQRYTFWQTKLNNALEQNNAEEVETASGQISKIEAEAKAAGAVVGSASAGASASVTDTGGATVLTKSKSVKGKEAVAKRAAALAEKKASGTGGNGAAKTPRAKKEKVLQPCLDGCGVDVPGNFKMGHDAKLKSMILKVERGEMDMNELPEIAQELVGFKKGEKETLKDKAGKKTGETQYMICTKAPVRFQGRPEITLTQRAA